MDKLINETLQNILPPSPTGVCVSVCAIVCEVNEERYFLFFFVSSPSPKPVVIGFNICNHGKSTPGADRCPETKWIGCHSVPLPFSPWAGNNGT